MEVSYSLNKELIFDKKIEIKHIIKFSTRVVTLTLLLISCSNLIVFASTPWYKKAMTEAELAVYFRLLETVGAERVIKGIKSLENTPSDIVKWCIDKGYLIEEIISFFVENR